MFGLSPINGLWIVFPRAHLYKLGPSGTLFSPDPELRGLWESTGMGQQTKSALHRRVSFPLFFVFPL